MEQKKEEELSMLTFASNMNKSLIKMLMVSLILNVAIVLSFLLYNHFTVSQITETTTLTAEPNADVVGGNLRDSTITTYPNTSTSTNSNTNK